MTRTQAYQCAPLKPGSPEWQQRMTGSKVAAVLGLSSYDSAFSVYHRMVGLLDPVPSNEIMERGHYLEPAIAAWFTDQHPELTVETTGTWANTARPPWQAVNPDRLCFTANGNVYPLEIKSALRADLWDDGPPPGVLAQVLWTLDTLELETAYVAVLTLNLEFNQYEVKYDPAEMRTIRAIVDPFMDRVARREPPPIDGHDATYQALRELHPDIDGTTVDLPEHIGRAYLTALRARAEAKTAWLTASSHVLEAMGTAEWGAHLGTRICSRIGSPDKPPYLRAMNGVAAAAHTTEGTPT
jgi:putative phage-type endonuclease